MTGDQPHVTRQAGAIRRRLAMGGHPAGGAARGRARAAELCRLRARRRHDEAMDIAVKVLAPFFGPPQAIVIGRGERPDALNAAFLNAVSANVLEYDDTHLRER